MITISIPGQLGSTITKEVPKSTIWFQLVVDSVGTLKGEISDYPLQLGLKAMVPTEIHKYNDNYLCQEDSRQIWWKGERWKAKNFDGFVIQRAILIVFNILFPDQVIVEKVARSQHQKIDETVDVTELPCMTYLDLSHTPIVNLEGLQFLFKLKVINLKETNH